MNEGQENTNTSLQIQGSHEIAPGISAIDKELVISYKEAPRFKDLDSDQVITKLSALIYKIYFEVSDNNTLDKDKESITAINIRDINRYFSDYSLKDIERCYEMGVRGEFTQKIQKFHGACNVSVEMLYSWLREFRNHRSAIIRRQAQFESGKHEQLLLENKKEHQRRHQQLLQEIIEEYNKFLSEPQYPRFFQQDFGNIIYNYFDKGKQIHLKTETKEKLIKQALKTCIEQYEGLKSKLSGTPTEGKSIEDIILKLPTISTWIADEMEKSSAGENKERLNWLKQLPASWKQWGDHVKTNAHQKLINEIFFISKRLALRVVIYDWKNEKRKIEDIIQEIEKQKPNN